jgi:hypothetical protein
MAGKNPGRNALFHAWILKFNYDEESAVCKLREITFAALLFKYVALQRESDG